MSVFRSSNICLSYLLNFLLVIFLSLACSFFNLNLSDLVLSYSCKCLFVIFISSYSRVILLHTASVHESLSETDSLRHHWHEEMKQTDLIYTVIDSFFRKTLFYVYPLSEALQEKITPSCNQEIISSTLTKRLHNDTHLLLQFIIRPKNPHMENFTLQVVSTDIYVQSQDSALYHFISDI